MNSWHPEIIPINREEDYHTHFIGTTSDNKQFFGYETFVFPDGMPQANWEDQRKEYAVLHTFDIAGNHLETKHWYAGTSKETDGQKTRNKLEEMISELGEITYSNISVRPFETLIDGIKFGLIPDSETQSINLQPSSTIAFFDPWDGEYYT